MYDYKAYLFLTFLVLGVQISIICGDTGVLNPFSSNLLRFSGVHSKESTNILHANRKDLSDINRVPVVIIPSLIGNQIWGKLDRKEVEHWYCDKHADWYPLFFNSKQFYPLVVNCWISNMKLNYNTENRTFHDPEGVSTKFPDYGGVDSVSYIDTEKQMPLWYDIIESLISFGYQPNVNIRSAPYDWRVGPMNYKDQFDKLKELIEDTFNINNQSKVALISLSMGGNYAAKFLGKMEQTWKDKYVHSFNSLSGAFGGSTFSISELLSPDINSYPEWLDSSSLQGMLQTFGSILWLFPNKEIFGTETLISTSHNNYSAYDYIQLLDDAKLYMDALILQDIESGDWFEIDNPGVPINCFIGYNISTLSRLNYQDNTFESGKFNFTVEDGDGTVTLRALSYHCDKWKKQQQQQQQQQRDVNIYKIPNMNHGAAVSNPIVIKTFLSYIGLV